MQKLERSSLPSTVEQTDGKLTAQQYADKMWGVLSRADLTSLRKMCENVPDMNTVLKKFWIDANYRVSLDQPHFKQTMLLVTMCVDLAVKTQHLSEQPDTFTFRFDLHHDAHPAPYAVREILKGLGATSIAETNDPGRGFSYEVVMNLAGNTQ